MTIVSVQELPMSRILVSVCGVAVHWGAMTPAAAKRSSRTKADLGHPTMPGRAAKNSPMPESDLEQIVGAIGPKLRELRDENGLSLQQLSDRSDVSPAAIHKVVRPVGCGESISSETVL